MTRTACARSLAVFALTGLLAACGGPAAPTEEEGAGEALSVAGLGEPLPSLAGAQQTAAEVIRHPAPASLQGRPANAEHTRWSWAWTFVSPIDPKSNEQEFVRIAVAPYAVKVVRHWSSKQFGFQIFASMAKVSPAAALAKLHLRPSQVKTIDLGTAGDGSVTWMVQPEAGGHLRVVDAISGEVWW